MEPITYNIRLDTARAGVQATLSAKRGDARVRRIVAHLYSGATPYELPETGVTATLWADKPDGTRVFKYAAIEGDAITVVLTSQMFAAVGLVNCELQVIGADGAFLTTPRFDINVEDALMNDEEIESTDEFSVLVEALTRVEEIEAQEQGRIDAEVLRAEAEKARVEEETARAEAEQERITAESGRVEAETERAEAEAERLDAEAERVSNEAVRVEAEKGRITAESGRVTAENKREQDTGAAVAAAEKATQAANAAAESTGAARDAAQEAADRANAAAKACEDIALGEVGWDTILDKPEEYAPSAHAQTHACDGSDRVTAEMLGITGQRAGGAAVAVDDVIPDTALTELVVYGKSTQDGTPSPDVSIPTGNNLFRGIGVPNGEDWTGYYISVANTTATSDGFARFSVDNTSGTTTCYCDRFARLEAARTIEPKKDYKLLVEFRNVREISSDTLFYADGQYEIGGQYGAFKEILIPSEQITENSRILHEVTAKDDFSIVTIALRSQCHVPAGSVCDFEARISIYPADYDVTEYEPYQGGPVDIVSEEVGSAVSCGANLFRGIGVPNDEEGYYTLTLGTQETSDGYARYYMDNTNAAGRWAMRNVAIDAHLLDVFSPNTSYKILVEFRNVKSVSGNFFASAYHSNELPLFSLAEVPKSSVQSGVYTTGIITTIGDFSNAITFIRTGMQVSAGTVCDFEARISIYPADYDVTEYEPYTATTIPVNLTLRGIPVGSGGNYTDGNGQQWICDTYDAASGEHVQRIKELALQNTMAIQALENWEQERTFAFAVRALEDQLNTTRRETLICNSFPVKDYAVTSGSSPDEIGCNRNYGTAIANVDFRVSKEMMVQYGLDTDDLAGTKVSAVKAYLAAQQAAGTPVTVLYVLAEPITTYFTPQYISAYSPVTNVSAGGAEIGIEYNNIAGSAKARTDTLAPAEIGAAGADALEELKAEVAGKANAVKTVTATLTAAGWTGSAAPYTQTVTVSGVTANSTGNVGVADGATDAQYQAALKARLRKSAQAANSITVKAYGAKPAADIPIAVQII